jgi:hypothetical protein
LTWDPVRLFCSCKRSPDIEKVRDRRQPVNAGRVAKTSTMHHFYTDK